jgi:hypothetical protein
MTSSNENVKNTDFNQPFEEFIFMELTADDKETCSQIHLPEKLAIPVIR